MTAHKHADLIMEYAKVAQKTETPWEYFQFLGLNGKWEDCSLPVNFLEGHEYRLKPHKLEIELTKRPVPLRNAPDDEETYYVAIISNRELYAVDNWCDDATDNRLLEAGLIHYTKEAAIAHAKLLLELNKQLIA